MTQTTADVPRCSTTVRPSSIHGQGLFAEHPIPADTLIGVYDGPRVTDEADDGDHVLWIEDDAGQWFGIDGRNAMRYVNHSKSPNAVFYDAELWSIRDIAPGEEITHDYGDGWE